MTFENKIVVGLEDIKAVIFECRKCQTRVSVKPDEVRVPYKCPNPTCGQQWQPDYDEHVPAHKSPYLKFCTALSQCRAPQHNGAPFNILLEFEGQS
ncbi:MAG: hypothetical protein ACR2IF_14150 [Terriglobales bacterium]